MKVWVLQIENQAWQGAKFRVFNQRRRARREFNKVFEKLKEDGGGWLTDENGSTITAICSTSSGRDLQHSSVSLFELALE